MCVLKRFWRGNKSGKLAFLARKCRPKDATMKPFKNGLAPDAISLYTIVLLPQSLHSFKKGLRPQPTRIFILWLESRKGNFSSSHHHDPFFWEGEIRSIWSMNICAREGVGRAFSTCLEKGVQTQVSLLALFTHGGGKTNRFLEFSLRSNDR